MEPNYLEGGLYLALATVIAYGTISLNRFEKSLERYFERNKTALVIPLSGKDYKENARLAREMGHPEIAEKIDEIRGKNWEELQKLGLEEKL